MSTVYEVVNIAFCTYDYLIQEWKLFETKESDVQFCVSFDEFNGEYYGVEYIEMPFAVYHVSRMGHDIMVADKTWENARILGLQEKKIGIDFFVNFFTLMPFSVTLYICTAHWLITIKKASCSSAPPASEKPPRPNYGTNTVMP